jgi:hypothetical protein
MTVIDFADWLATTEPPPPALVGPSSTPEGRAAARRLLEDALRQKEQKA